MSFNFTLTTSESSVWPQGSRVGGEPSADAIWDALNTVRLPSGAEWVGPLARISRIHEVSIKPFKTFLKWILSVSGPYSPDGALQIAHQVARQMNVALARVSADWARVAVAQYNPATDGAIVAWQSGAAAVPSLHDTLPNSVGEVVESGVEFLNRATKTITDPLKPYLYGGIVIAGLYLTWPILMKLRSRANPTANLLKRGR